MSYYIIIRGPLGCGKTTVAKKLAKKLDGIHISVDKVLDDNNLTKDKEEGYVSQKSFKKANSVAVGKVKEIIKAGKPVVFDGNFYWKSQITDLIKKLEFKHFVFTLIIPLEKCIERDNNRKNTHGEGAARVVFEKTMSFRYGIEIDNNGSVDACIRKIMGKLDI